MIVIFYEKFNDWFVWWKIQWLICLMKNSMIDLFDENTMIDMFDETYLFYVP